jgi:hypothetical protein
MRPRRHRAAGDGDVSIGNWLRGAVVGTTISLTQRLVRGPDAGATADGIEALPIAANLQQRSKHMSTSQGQFVWYELMTTDTAAATAFYQTVIGWTARDAGVADMDYTILSAGDVAVGGLMALPQPAGEAGPRPGWIGYIAVDDVDATAARVAAAGGSVHREPSDIPNVGRFAVVGDPQGASFILFRPLPGGPPPTPAAQTPGRIGWHELHAAEWEAAFAFYAGLFGWTKSDTIDMGPMGIYQTFASDPGGAMNGGMMTKAEAVPAPYWLYYFNVEDIDAAVKRTEAAGGSVLNGPHQVPGGSWIVQARDPQGAVFAVVGPKG